VGEGERKRECVCVKENEMRERVCIRVCVENKERDERVCHREKREREKERERDVRVCLHVFVRVFV